VYWLLPPRDYRSRVLLCVHLKKRKKICSHHTPPGYQRGGPPENKYDDQTNSIKPNLLNPIQALNIPLPLKMLHPLVLIPAQCCLQQLFFYCVVLTTTVSLSLSLVVFFICSFFLQVLSQLLFWVVSCIHNYYNSGISQLSNNEWEDCNWSIH